MDANPIVLDDVAEDVVVVVVEGEHDIYTAPTLRERLDEAIARGAGVVVDLTGATFVDSSVLGALLDARRRALDASRASSSASGTSRARRAAHPRHHRPRARASRGQRPGGGDPDGRGVRRERRPVTSTLPRSA